MTSKILKLYKTSLFWLTVVVLNIAVGIGGVYAAAPTADDLVRSAQYYLDGAADSGFLRELNNIMWSQDEDSRRSIHDSLKGKLIALRSKDGTGNTLAHKIISDGYRGHFMYLFRVEGLAVLEAKNASGQMPLSTLPTDEKVQVLLNLRRSTDGDEGLSREFSSYLKAYELQPLKRQVSVLVKEIDALKLEFPEKIKEWGSEQAQELRAKISALARIVDLSPSVLEGQKLENLEDLFGALKETLEGRAVLRGYRIGGRKSLLQYYAEKISSEERDYWDFRGHLQAILTSYFEDRTPITHQDWDITEFDSSLQDLIVQTFRPEDVKQFFLTYKNSKKENLVQIVARKLSSFWELGRLREAISDDTEFLKLLTVAAPKTESAETMLMKTLDGQKFLKELDPKYWVKAGPYGVTPLMLKTLEGDDEAFKTILAELKSRGIRVDQRDSFGNTAESIRAIVASEGYRATDVLLNKSMKSRPFQDSLWDEVINFPYQPVQESYRFIDSALGLVRSQSQTGLHHAFFQRDVRNHRAEANALWRSFFRTYDSLVDAELERQQQSVADGWGDPTVLERRQSEAGEERKLPSAIRYLMMVVPKIRVLEDLSEGLPEVDDTIGRVLVGRSTFGINFSRKATLPEARFIVGNIKEVAKTVGRRFEDEFAELQRNPPDILEMMKKDLGMPSLSRTSPQDVFDLVCTKLRQRYKKPEATLEYLIGEYAMEKMQPSIREMFQGRIREIKSAFFQDYLPPIDAEKAGKLLNHRLNCAVVALFDFVAERSNGRDGQVVAQMLGIPDDERIFDFIDLQLKDKVQSGTIVNSRARFERLQARYPDAFNPESERF